MNFRSNSKSRNTSILVSLLLLLSCTSKINAQSTIGIVPPKFELLANPGEVITEKVKITSDAPLPTTYSIIVEDFSSAGEEGQVVLEEEGSDSAYSLAKWIQPEVSEITLQPDSEAEISFNITIPRDAEPGGHYASILMQSNTDSVPGAAVVSQRIGSLILLRVTGNVIEDAKVEAFDTPTFSETSPISFTLRLNNDGNVHIRPKGTIIITNLFGNKVDEIPLRGQNVLPGSTRLMETEWESGSVLGTYTATLVATYGQQNLPLTSAVRFSVASRTAMILIAVGGISLIFFIFSIISGRSRVLQAIKILAGKD